MAHNGIVAFLKRRGDADFVLRYGPWAVVTGASLGIGRAIAIDLARRGVRVVLVARNEAALRSLAEGLAVESRVLSLDLAEAGASARLDAATRDLDVGLLVAAAGFGTSGAFLDADLEEEAAMIDVNCRATTEGALLFGRRFAARGRGGIVLFGSLVGFQGVPRAAHYAATKAYVQTLAEALHFEFRPSGVDVLSCAPGPVASGFATRAHMSLGRTATPEAVARPTLDALGRRMTVVPDRLSKLLTFSLAALPRALRVRIMGHLMAGMTRGDGGG